MSCAVTTNDTTATTGIYVRRVFKPVSVRLKLLRYTNSPTTLLNTCQLLTNQGVQMPSKLWDNVELLQGTLVTSEGVMYAMKMSPDRINVHREAVASALEEMGVTITTDGINIHIEKIVFMKRIFGIVENKAKGISASWPDMGFIDR